MNGQNQKIDDGDARLEIYEPSPYSLYSIEDVAKILNISRRQIAIYCKHGLVKPFVEPNNQLMLFDEESILILKRVEHLRAVRGFNLEAIKIIIDLLREVERLKRELRDLRMR